MSIKLLGISGSLRRLSCNTGLLRAAQKQLPPGVTLEITDLADVPFYNADIQAKPAAVTRVLEQMADADAFVFACPEYNYSLAPALKNILDWASREPGNTLLSDKAVAIMGAGGGMGSSRAQYHLRQVCVYLNLHPLNKPEVFANTFTGGFDAEGNLTDSKVTQTLADQMQALAAWAQRIKA
jgi:chromate reductase